MIHDFREHKILHFPDTDSLDAHTSSELTLACDWYFVHTANRKFLEGEASHLVMAWDWGLLSTLMTSAGIMLFLAILYVVQPLGFMVDDFGTSLVLLLVIVSGLSLVGMVRRVYLLHHLAHQGCLLRGWIVASKIRTTYIYVCDDYGIYPIRNQWVNLRYTFRSPKGMTVTAAIEIPLREQEHIPQPGTPVAILYVDEATYHLL